MLRYWNNPVETAGKLLLECLMHQLFPFVQDGFLLQMWF